MCTSMSKYYSTQINHSLTCSVHLFSHVQLCATPCCNTPGLPVHHQLPELTQTPVHRVGEAIQSSHPMLSPFPPACNLFQHQGLF